MIKYKIIWLLLIFFQCGNLAAQNKVEIAAEHLRLAMISADITSLEKLTDDSLSYGHSSGVIETKQRFIERIRTGSSDFISIDIINQHVIIRDKTATVRHILSAVTNDNGVPGNIKLNV